MKRKKVAIITGASSGIGEALAFELAKLNYHIVLAARSQNKLLGLQKELKDKFSCDSMVVPTDVSLKAECENLIQKTITEFGQLDLLINNAGISMRAKLEDVKLEVLEQLMQVNFWGAVYCTKYALPQIIKSKGTIVAVSSIAGHRGLPERTGYSASKFAMQGFFEGLRTELMSKGVHVLVACPGFTQSNIRNIALNAKGEPQGESPREESQMMTAEEVARHIVKAIKNKKRDLILTRIGKLTVLLNSVFPSWMDKQVLKEFKKENDTTL